MFIVNVDTLERVDGTVCVMSGLDEDDGRRYLVAVDRAIAFDLCCIMDVDGPVPCFVERWQVIGIDPIPAA